MLDFFTLQFFYFQTKLINRTLRRMLVFEQAVEAATETNIRLV